MRALKIIILCFLTNSSFSQRMAQQNMYPFNPSLINPAIAGMSECAQFELYGLKQWAGIHNAPSIEGFGIQKGIRFSRSKKHGLGIDFVRDINGASSSIGSEMMYSFHFRVDRSGKNWVGLGLSGIVFMNQLDESQFSPIADPIITGGIQQNLLFNATAGCVLYSDKYFAGLAVYNLLPYNSELTQGYGYDRFYITIYGGLTHSRKGSYVSWLPSFYGAKGENILQTDLTNTLKFKNNIISGFTLRKYWLQGESPGQDILFLIGYEWKRWTLQYTYDFGLNSLLFHQYGSHMAALSYRICRDKYACPTYK